MGEGLSLLPATAEDVDTLRSLTRDAYSKWVLVIGREPKPMTADYAEAVNKHRIDLLYLDGKVAALIEMIPDAHHLLMENVAVSPAFQGRRLGRMLWDRTEAHLDHLRGGRPGFACRALVSTPCAPSHLLANAVGGQA